MNPPTCFGFHGVTLCKCGLIKDICFFFFALQIKLLLQKQSTALPNPNTLLTPPRTPQFDVFHGNRQSPNHSPVPMVTACTNTGASLLLATPIKPNAKKSVATSPMNESEVKKR